MKRRVAILIAVIVVLFCGRVFAAGGVSWSADEGSGNEEGICAAGEWRCSDDAYVLETCVAGRWEATRCMESRGQLCEAGACVDPWRYGSPQWSRAADEPLATPESLAEKARGFEERIRRVYIQPEMRVALGLHLPCRKVQCAPGQELPCEDCTQTDVPWDKVTWRDVVRWQSGENDGLFSGLYLTSQGFRYAVTSGDERKEALDMINLLLDGVEIRTRITGVPGLFARAFIPPGIKGLEHLENPKKYHLDEFKENTYYTRIGDDGCCYRTDPETNEWVNTGVCGRDEFAGWTFRGNVSKDEYTGHLFSLGVIHRLVDDPQVRERTRTLLMDVGRHLVKNRLEIVDWDGKTTKYGKLYAMTMADHPGFNAAMSLSFIKVIAEETGDPRFDDWYRTCLLQQDGRRNCLKKPTEQPRPYTDYLGEAGLYTGVDGCGFKFFNVSMHMLSMFNLLWYEHDPELRAVYQEHLENVAFRPEGVRVAACNQNNAMYDFIYAAMRNLGPGSDGPAYAEVENGIRMMKQFPARKYDVEIKCRPGECESHCKGWRGRGHSETAREIARRCMDISVWWTDPFRIEECGNNTRVSAHPGDYLLTYWMGRYFGFISEDM